LMQASVCAGELPMCDQSSTQVTPNRSRQAR
jgi:hypothetical protein